MKKKTITFIIIIIGAILAFLSDYMPKEYKEMPKINEHLRVTFLDVGQGDSTLLELPNGEVMLIDAGNPEDGEKIVSQIKEKGYDRIDYLIATHPHADHIGGMAEIVESFEIGKIYMPKKSHNISSFERLVDAAIEKKLSITEAKSGVMVMESDNLKISILSPMSGSYDDLNNYSAVVKAEYGATAFLFMGDAEKQVEYELLSSGLNLSADVLKVGHHGSGTSSTGKFIRAVRPIYGIISCGKDNDYGHPHSKVLDILNENSIDVLRTDKSGNIVISSDGINLKVEKSE